MKEITNISQKSPLCIPAFLNTGLFALLIAFLAPFANCKSDNKKDAPSGPRDPLINTSLQTKCEMDGGSSKRAQLPYLRLQTRAIGQRIPMVAIIVLVLLLIQRQILFNMTGLRAYLLRSMLILLKP